MKELYQAELTVACSLASDSEKLTYSMSVLRSLLQTLAVSAVEVALASTPSSEDDLALQPFLERLGQPTEGLMIELIDHLVHRVRSLADRNYYRGWYEAAGGNQIPLAQRLTEWVQFRNKRVAHGVVDVTLAEDGARSTIDIIALTLKLFDEWIPEKKAGILTAKVAGTDIPLTTPLSYHSKAIVITRISSKRGIWHLDGQTLDNQQSSEFRMQLAEHCALCRKEDHGEKFPIREVCTGGATHIVFNNVPARQTAIFVGRQKELDRLRKWIAGETNETSTCLIYGDGGFGKTTLALEFFNSLLEGSINASDLFPSVISFYTAKRTKWTVDGLTRFKGISEVIEDGIRELMLLLTPVIPRDLYRLHGRALVDRISQEYRKQGFARDHIILIIDNTETLANSTHDAEELGDFMSAVARNLCRIVITSRRREHLASVPVHVSRLEEEEALALLRRLGKECNAIAIVQAGPPKLKQACHSLMYKPLLIDTLARYVGRTGGSIQDGLDHILKRTNDELLDFLYDDAWARMEPGVQDVFMALVTLASPLDSKCIGETCMEFGVLHSEFQASLSETYFATTIDHGDSYEIEIVELAERFFTQKKNRLNSTKIEEIKDKSYRIDQRAADRHRVEQEYKNDRVADAFRSDYAKAAKISYIGRNFEEAKSFFALALTEDPLNSALKERYASFLHRNLGDSKGALEHAVEATRLDPNSGDAWLTRALIHYRLGDLAGGDISIDNARRHGKSNSLCLLRRGIARYHHSKESTESEHQVKALTEALNLINRSISDASLNDQYYAKNLKEAQKYALLTKAAIKRERSESRQPGMRSQALKRRVTSLSSE
jgi:tetratricopeptide (TPR) repeat protein